MQKEKIFKIPLKEKQSSEDAKVQIQDSNDIQENAEQTNDNTNPSSIGQSWSSSFSGLSKASLNCGSDFGFKIGKMQNGISIKNKANLGRFNSFMNKLEEDLDDGVISKQFQVDEDEI